MSTLGDKAYEEIKNLIAEGVYMPGQQLQEAELSNRLNMSRTPIREALLRLQEDMAVTIKPHAGATVATLDMHQLCNLYELREAIEGMIARLNCRSTISVVPYQNLYERFTEAQKIEDTEKRHKVLGVIDADYFDLLNEGCHNPFLVKQAIAVHQKVHSLYYVSHIIPHFPDVGAKERMEVLEAIIAKDPEKAESIARFRIRKCLKRILMAAVEH